MWVVRHPSVGIVFDEVLVILTLVLPVGFHLTQLTKVMVGGHCPLDSSLEGLFSLFLFADSLHGYYYADLLSVIMQCSVAVLTLVAFFSIMWIMGLVGPFGRLASSWVGYLAPGCGLTAFWLCLPTTSFK